MMLDDQTLAVRAALHRRVDALRSEARRLSCGTIAIELETIRLAAAASRLGAAGMLRRAFSQALVDQGRGALMAGWFAGLSDAIGCQADDEAHAADVCLASVMVRMS
jgi:hypothetical protein